MTLEQQTRALLDLVEADRARRCAQLLDDATRRADALCRQAQAHERARMREAFEAQRRVHAQHLAAAQARLATRRRLHAQQRTTALLQRAWQQLPAALHARWLQPASRAAWVTAVLGSARSRLPQGRWRIVHPDDWPAAERQTLGAALAADHDTTATFQADPAVRAGLKIISGGNVIDGTLDGLLADRTAVEARLLHHLESSS